MKKKKSSSKKSAKEFSPAISTNSSKDERSQLTRDHKISKFENMQKNVNLEKTHDDDVEFYKGNSDLMHFHQKQVEKRYQIDKKELKNIVANEQDSFDKDIADLDETTQKKEKGKNKKEQ